MKATIETRICDTCKEHISEKKCAICKKDMCDKCSVISFMAFANIQIGDVIGIHSKKDADDKYTEKQVTTRLTICKKCSDEFDSLLKIIDDKDEKDTKDLHIKIIGVIRGYNVLNKIK
jgi:hypothetical protein